MPRPKHGTPERYAMEAYPRQTNAQAHWLRGWYCAAGTGDFAELQGTWAEEYGRRSFIEQHPEQFS